MSFYVIPQGAVTPILDSSYCSKRHFVRQQMSFFHRFFLYFDPVYGSTLTGYQCPTHDTPIVLISAPFGASFVLVNCIKI